MNVLDSRSRCIAFTSLVYRFDYEFVVLSGMTTDTKLVKAIHLESNTFIYIYIYIYYILHIL